MTLIVSSLLIKVKELLANAGVVSYSTESEYILMEFLNCDRAALLLDEMDLSKDSIDKIMKVTRDRCSGVPLQYLLGKSYFRDIVLKSGPGVLIPRPETELLIDIVNEFLNYSEQKKVLDLGTGTGAIALSVATENSDSDVLGVDISKDALLYAEKNRELLSVDNIRFIESDLFENISSSFDVITANLPYISKKLYDRLPAEVKNFEPISALLAEDDGMSLIKKTINLAPQYLRDGGLLILEISFEQAPKLFNCLNENPNYIDIILHDDLNGLCRFISAKKESLL